MEVVHRRKITAVFGPLQAKSNDSRMEMVVQGQVARSTMVRLLASEVSSSFKTTITITITEADDAMRSKSNVGFENYLTVDN